MLVIRCLLKAEVVGRAVVCWTLSVLIGPHPTILISVLSKGAQSASIDVEELPNTDT